MRRLFPAEAEVLQHVPQDAGKFFYIFIFIFAVASTLVVRWRSSTAASHANRPNTLIGKAGSVISCRMEKHGGEEHTQQTVIDHG